MEPVTQVLSREHRVVLARLDDFEKALDGYSPDALFDALRFFDERLILHRRKEEEILFPALARHFPPNIGPVSCMLEEHRDEKVHLDGLRRALEAGEREVVITHGRHILKHLRNHIWKEDNILFPMAERLLGAEEIEVVRKGFQAIGCCCPECGPACDAEPFPCPEVTL